MRRFKLPFIAVLFPLFAIVALAQLPRDSNSNKASAMAALRQEAPRVLFYSEGGNVSRIYGVPFARGTSPRDTAERFVANYADIFEPGDATFRLDGTRILSKGKFTAVRFNQEVGGYEVDKGYLVVLVKNMPGYPAVLVNAHVRDVDAFTGSARLTSRDAIARARAQSPSLKTFTTPEFVIWPGARKTHLAWTFIGDNGDLRNPKKFEVFVDAESGKVLEWRNQVYTVDVSGNIQGMASPGLKPDQPNNPPMQIPLAGMRINITGGGFAFTNAAGDYTIANGGTDPVTVNAELKGHVVRVVAAQGTLMAPSQTVTPPGPADFLFNGVPTQYDTSQVNVFKHVEAARDFVKSISPAYPGLDDPIVANVNINNQCNASYSGALNFYAAGGGCPNTGYSTVVYHEYGHMIVGEGNRFASPDYHEGMADALSYLLTNSPFLAEDFHGQNAGPLRLAVNTVTHPCTGEEHHCGNVISGAFWETLDALKAAVGEAEALELVRGWFFDSILLEPIDIGQGITIDILTLDDNDANIYNGTPHYGEIAQGFGQKGLFAPQLDWVTFLERKTPGEIYLVPTNVQSKVLFAFNVNNGIGVLDPTSVRLHYRVNAGTWQSKEALLDAPTNLYKGILTVISGDYVHWYMSAKDVDGHTCLYPASGQMNPKSFVAAKTIETTQQFTFDEPGNTGWTAEFQQMTSGHWAQADPNGYLWDGRQANPEFDSDDVGAKCIFSGQGPAGSLGFDVGGGPMRLMSPFFDMSSGYHIIEYRRWLFCDNGEDPLVVEVSNNGTTWVPVEAVYDDGTTNKWIVARFAVSKYVTPTATVKARFVIKDNPDNSVTEVAIDNVVVKRATF